MWLLPSLLILTFAAATTPASRGHRHLRVARTLQSGNARTLTCHITMEFVSEGEDSGPIHKIHQHYECAPVRDDDVSDFTYKIDLPTSFIEQNQNDLLQGALFANIPGGQIVNGTVVYPLTSEISSTSSPESFKARHRRLVDGTMGTRRVLVLRITAADTTNTYSAEQMHNYIFDDSEPDDKPTLLSQYQKLSFGKLSLSPTEGGVIEVQVPINAKGATSMAIRDAAISAVLDTYEVSSITNLAEHIIFCIPPGTGNWAGSSPVRSWRIVMNDKWCGYLSGLMHEMGHNLGLLHSNLNNAAYMDFTSYMSAGYGTPYWPAKSFNGANNWQFGWYSDRQLVVDPSQGGRMVQLATFVDYEKTSWSTPVLVQVGTDTYLQYNRAKGFNYQSQQNIDQVTVVQQLSNGTNLIGAIDLKKNPQLSIPDFGGSGRTVVLSACGKGEGSADKPDWMTISIGYDRSYCPQTTAFDSATVAPVQPTPAPIEPTRAPVQPTAAPIEPTPAPVQPTRAPVQPTKAPVQPTNSPVQPTKAPVQPTKAPVHPTPAPVQPTTAPIQATPTPSIEPTMSPVQPSLAPSVSPSSSPTVQPSLVPSVQSSSTPSLVPSVRPTPTPSQEVPGLSIQQLSEAPSQQPPTLAPSVPPTRLPTRLPTKRPTVRPTKKPRTARPTKRPPTKSTRPSTTAKPTKARVPTKRPTSRPFSKSSVPTARPTVTPIGTRDGDSGNELCVDTSATFMVPTNSSSGTNDGILRGCDWLSANTTRPRIRTQLCLETQIQNACPRTCQLCSSFCVDQIVGTFVDESGRSRNCLWLSLRTNKMAMYCPRPDVSTLCPVTCRTC